MLTSSKDCIHLIDVLLNRHLYWDLLNLDEAVRFWRVRRLDDAMDPFNWSTMKLDATVWNTLLSVCRTCQNEELVELAAKMVWRDHWSLRDRDHTEGRQLLPLHER
jgi:hypothetical protein